MAPTEIPRCSAGNILNTGYEQTVRQICQTIHVAGAPAKEKSDLRYRPSPGRAGESRPDGFLPVPGASPEHETAAQVLEQPAQRLFERLDPILDVALDLLELLRCQHRAQGLELLTAEVAPLSFLGLILLHEGGVGLPDLVALFLG